MPILNKPAAGTFSFDSGQPLAADALFMIDEASGNLVEFIGGSVVGVVTSATWSLDGGRSYLRFDGFDDIVTIANIFGITASMTIVLVVRQQAAVPAAYHEVAYIGDASQGDRWAGIAFNNTADGGVWDITSRYDAASDSDTFDSDDHQDDTWHLVAAKFATDSKAGSVDGAAFTAGAHTFTFPGAHDIFSLGATPDTSPQFGECDIAGLWIYADTELSDAQIGNFDPADPWSAFLKAAQASYLSAQGVIANP